MDLRPSMDQPPRRGRPLFLNRCFVWPKNSAKRALAPLLRLRLLLRMLLLLPLLPALRPDA